MNSKIRTPLLAKSVAKLKAWVRVSPPSAHARVLFVEDDQAVREHMVGTLSDEFDIEAASDGEHALLAVMRKRPELIVTDIVMPGLDGVQLVRRLRESPSTATIPILMISGRASEELRTEGFEVGADAYLSKPYSVLEARAHALHAAEQSPPG